jgi:hypothetical protein
LIEVTAISKLERSDSLTIEGIVYDSLDSEPLEYALIRIQGKEQETMTDQSGRFKLDRVQRGDTLAVMSILYHKKMLRIQELLMTGRSGFPFRK